MMVEYDLGDLEKNVKQIIADVEGPIRRKAGKNAGHKLADELSNNTAKATGEMSESTTVGPVEDDGNVMVGYGRSTYFRVHPVNMGSEFQPGQHFVEKTVETSSEMVMRSYMEDLKKGLGL